MAGYSVTVVRAAQRSRESRDEFIREQGGFGGASFCHAIDQALVLAGLKPPAESASDAMRIPWVTPVLGSGCLDGGSATELSPAAFRVGVFDTVTLLLGSGDKEWKRSVDLSFDAPKLAQAFTTALAEERLISRTEEHKRTYSDPVDESGADAGGMASKVEIGDATARAVLVAAMLNRLYFTAKARITSPPSRFSGDLIEVDLDEPIEEELHEQCRRHIAAFLKNDSRALAQQPAITQAIRTLLGEVSNRLGMGEIDLLNVRLTTEVAWYLITSETSMYPGWGELLFKLMLIDDQGGESSSRPWFANLSAIGNQVAALLAEPTKRSWAARERPEPNESVRRSEFYDAVAGVLVEQACARLGRDSRLLPVPTGFLTSFDMELAMAVHKNLAPDRSIYVVLPVQVLPDRTSSTAKLCWIRAKLRRPDDGPHQLEAALEQFLSPLEWDVVHSDLEHGIDDPHLIHLAGCPLLELPEWSSEHRNFLASLADSLTDQGLQFDPQSMKIAHAVVVDEYLALQQSEAEILWSVSARSEPTRSLALPQLFTASSPSPQDEGHCPRYWMALGVPLDDPAVRNRVIAQLTLRSLLTKVGETTPMASAGPVFGAPVSLLDNGGFGDALGQVPETPTSPPQATGRAVFVSHSKEDAPLVELLVSDLERAGIKCWFAPRDIELGESYGPAVGRAIENAGAVAVLVSAASDQSEWVLREVEMADSAKLPILPLSYEGYTATEQLRPFLSSRQHKSLDSPTPEKRNREWDEILAALRTALGIPVGASDPMDTEPQEAAPPVGTGRLIGVVVNRRVRREDAGILHWLGLDVVSDEASAFTDDIRHYAAHLRAAEPKWPVAPGFACEFGEVQQR